MHAYSLTVYQALTAGPAALVATVLRVEVAKPLEWVRAHADEIAARAAPARHGAPVALWLETLEA